MAARDTKIACWVCKVEDIAKRVEGQPVKTVRIRRSDEPCGVTWAWTAVEDNLRSICFEYTLSERTKPHSTTKTYFNRVLVPL